MAGYEEFSTTEELRITLEERLREHTYRFGRDVRLRTAPQRGHSQCVLAERCTVPDGQWVWVVWDHEDAQDPALPIKKVAVGTSLEDLLSTLKHPHPDVWISTDKAHTTYHELLASAG